MPHDYDPKTKQFVGMSRLTVRGEIDKLTAHVEKEATRIAKAFKSGGSLIEFETGMRELLKSAHIVSASIGKGGRERMTQSDWGKVGAKIKWQNGYLSKFARKIERGAVTELATVSRARSYASAIYISFANTFFAEQKEADGLQEGVFAEGKNPIQVRLVTNSEEGCVECANDEAQGWMSVDDMGELGSRLCGDFCRCMLEFDDAE